MNLSRTLLHPTSGIYHAVVMDFKKTANFKLCFSTIAAIAALLAFFGVTCQGQAPATSSAPTQAEIKAPAQAPNGIYIASDPLAGVRYDNHWDVSVGMASGHLHAGPNLTQGADLGGLDISASRFLSSRFRIEANGRVYLGTSGTPPAAHIYGESGVFVSEYFFLAGPEFLGPHNKHGAFFLHALVGGAYGDFSKELGRHGTMLGPTGPAGFYNNQFALGGAFGGHIDLNRSPHWVFRISPDALLTGYDGTSQYPHTQWNFGISVGAEYKFQKLKKK